MCQGSVVKSVRTRGRPPIRSDEEILRAALSVFAAKGYDATSVRALSAELGLSHETVHQRFGSKQSLYNAAVEFGVVAVNASFAAARANWPDELEGVDELRATVHSFITAASRHPEVGRLVNQEGDEDGERLDQLLEAVLRPWADALGALLQQLVDAGTIRPVTTREVFFLVQAAAGPFNLHRLSAVFDPLDGPLDPDHHVDNMTEFILRGLSATTAEPERNQ